MTPKYSPPTSPSFDFAIDALVAPCLVGDIVAAAAAVSARASAEPEGGSFPMRAEMYGSWRRAQQWVQLQMPWQRGQLKRTAYGLNSISGYLCAAGRQCAGWFRSR